MAQTIRLKRSAVAAKAPLTTDLALGELAINTFDGKMYFKKNVTGTDSIVTLANDDEVVKLSGDQTIAGLKTFSGNGSAPYGLTRFYTAINTYPPNTSFNGLFGVGVQAQQVFLGTGLSGSYSWLQPSSLFTTGKMSQDGEPSSNKDLVPLGYLNTQLATKANTSHTHGNITNAGAIGSTENLPIITTTSGVLTTGSFGTTANTFAEGNHTHSASDITSGTLAIANGGTGAATAETALTNLGAAADSNVVKLTGTQSVAGAKTFSDILSISNATASSSTTTGALRVTGGISTQGALHTGADAVVNGHLVGRGGGAVSSNIAVGSSALLTNTTGSNNSVMGVGALQNNTTGSNNVALGNNAAAFHSDGTTNLTDPEGCVYIGQECRGLNNSDSNSVVIAGRTATARGVGEGANTTVIGNAETTRTTVFGRIFQKPVGTDNVILGNAETGRFVASSNSGIIAIGGNALRRNLGQANNNIAIGFQSFQWAGNSTTPGTENVGLGLDTLTWVSTGVKNMAMGSLALGAVTTGSDNVGVGFYSLGFITTGGDNVALGSQTLLDAVTSVSGNVAIGRLALAGNISGDNNVAIGRDAGWKQNNGSTNLTGSTGNVFIGAYSRGNGNNQSNQIVIGETALGEGSNTTVIGKAATTSTKLFGKTTSQTNTATTNAVVYGLRTEHQSSGTPAIGIGTGIEFAAETAANNTEIGATVEAVTTNVTNTTEAFDLLFRTMSGGAAAAERFRITSAGNITAQGNTLRLVSSRTPASATAAGTAGEICWDASYIYVCTATNTWKRVAIATW